VLTPPRIEADANISPTQQPTLDRPGVIPADPGQFDVHLKVIQQRLGHKSITTTLDVYGHLLEGLDEGAAQALDEKRDELFTICSLWTPTGSCQSPATSRETPGMQGLRVVGDTGIEPVTSAA
jgi:hypothetical protein